MSRTDGDVHRDNVKDYRNTKSTLHQVCSRNLLMTVCSLIWFLFILRKPTPTSSRIYKMHHDIACTHRLPSHVAIQMRSVVFDRIEVPALTAVVSQRYRDHSHCSHNGWCHQSQISRSRWGLGLPNVGADGRVPADQHYMNDPLVFQPIVPTAPWATMNPEVEDDEGWALHHWKAHPSETTYNKRILSQFSDILNRQIHRTHPTNVQLRDILILDPPSSQQ